ncbi:MAG: SHOCT domain-containing protein [Planctomycetales bacterium]|jgi:hypothetical protein|nr:SHOCT domain-containing protein [Planctomycetales bacterium]MBN8624940.1 SHOCT domain-containing protein [Planctomycetota bacterium]
MRCTAVVLAVETAGARDVIWLVAGFAIAVAVGVYLVGKVRGAYRETDVPDTNLLTNFRELHARGELSDEEYRTIKAQLATKIREKLLADAESNEKIDFADKPEPADS